jgi:hypothetical protein
MPDSFSDVKAVFEQRSMYDGVVEANYMHHAELVATLANWARKQPDPLRVVDLGCGAVTSELAPAELHKLTSSVATNASTRAAFMRPSARRNTETII